MALTMVVDLELGRRELAERLNKEAIDRLERAAMAYERLGKLTRDDEKTRAIRKDAIAELAAARRAVMERMT